MLEDHSPAKTWAISLVDDGDDSYYPSICLHFHYYPNNILINSKILIVHIKTIILVIVISFTLPMEPLKLVEKNSTIILIRMMKGINSYHNDDDEEDNDPFTCIVGNQENPLKTKSTMAGYLLKEYLGSTGAIWWDLSTLTFLGTLDFPWDPQKVVHFWQRGQQQRIAATV